MKNIEGLIVIKAGSHVQSYRRIDGLNSGELLEKAMVDHLQDNEYSPEAAMELCEIFPDLVSDNLHAIADTEREKTRELIAKLREVLKGVEDRIDDAEEDEKEYEDHAFTVEVDLTVEKENWPGKKRIDEEVQHMVEHLMNKTVNATDWSYLITWQDEE